MMSHKRKFPLNKEKLKEMLDEKLKNLDYVELKWVSPYTFLSKVPPISRHFNEFSAKNLRERILKQKPIDPLYLDVKDGKVIHHEGRHRALVSKELGVDKIPVVYYHLK